MKFNTFVKHSPSKLFLSLMISVILLPTLCITEICYGKTISKNYLIAQTQGGTKTQENPPPAPAAQQQKTEETKSPPQTSTQDSPVTANQLLYQFKYKEVGEEQKNKTKLGAVKNLPNTTWTEALKSIVKILLNISGALALIAFTIGGSMMAFSAGNSNTLEKGKKITFLALIGLIIIAISYALVIGVSELQFFTN